jgi:hypothetical protein
MPADEDPTMTYATKPLQTGQARVERMSED